MNKDSKVIKCNECDGMIGVLTSKGLMIGNVTITTTNKDHINVTCDCGEVVHISILKHVNGEVYMVYKI
jgi:hypothetical protein